MYRALDSAAELAERAPPGLILGETWNVAVTSWDRCVCIRIQAPGVGWRERMPMPAKVARRLAHMVKMKIVEASYGVTIVGNHTAYNVPNSTNLH